MRERTSSRYDRRARLVNGQYLKKAHKLDMKYNSVGGVECGPMENAIRSRGEVCGLAFGSAGEASADVHRLARACADEIAGGGGSAGVPSTRIRSTKRRTLRVELNLFASVLQR